jgi:hypothetical protein
LPSRFPIAEVGAGRIVASVNRRQRQKSARVATLSRCAETEKLTSRAPMRYVLLIVEFRPDESKSPKLRNIVTIHLDFQ